MQRRAFLQNSLGVTSLSLLTTYSARAASPVGPTPDIINAGIGGNNTVDLLARIDADCLAQRPELTILMAGTNDVNSKKHVPLADYERNMRLMVSKLLAAKSQVMLMTILPVYEPYLITRHDPAFYKPEGHAARKTAMNGVIQRIATDNNLPLLDMHHIFEAVGSIGLTAGSLLKNEANSNKTDGVHPTPEGYRTMAVTIYTFLAQNKLIKNRIVCFGDSITKGDGEGQNYPAYLQQLVAA